jgi:hypothetical protein
MIIQIAKYEPYEQTTKTKLMEWESPNRIDIKDGDTIGERRL